MSYFTRLRDPILSLLKEEAAGPAAPVEAKPRDRAEAARRAWEVRRARYGPGGGNVGKGGAKDQPNQGNTADINRDLESALAKLKAHEATLEQSMPWAKKEKKRGGGINTSGIAEIDGKKYFAKMETESEASNEKGAWDAAQVLGWEDMGRPSAIFERSQANRDKKGVVLNPLLPEGEPLLEMTDGNMGIIKRMQSSDVHPTRDKIERMMIFEHVIGAVDRHGGNYWVDKNGELYGIDYGRSFMSYSDAERTTAGTDRSDEYGGLWDRQFNTDRTIAREHIQKIVDSESKLLDAVPAKGGWRTSRVSAQEAMTERIAKLRDILKNNKNKHIDLRDEGVFA